MVRTLIAAVFSLLVTGVAYLLTGSGPVSWFTFLALMGLFGLSEIGRQLDSLEGKLDAILERGRKD